MLWAVYLSRLEVVIDRVMDEPSPPPQFTQRLSSRLIGGLVSLIVLLVVVICSVIWFQGRPLLEDLNHKAQVRLGHNIALALGQQMRLIEGITRSLAMATASLPKDVTLYHQVIPPLLDQPGLDGLIAGGGVWPEPGAFAEGVERRSFFWGRKPSGELAFFDDYNDPVGEGYHHEEWYVPARLVPADKVYWSKSYTDPFSQQPMVTCTAPMRSAQGEFLGVATIDLMLDGVSSILDRLTEGMDAYAFVVDRNNKFITFPKIDMVVKERIEGGQRTADFLYTSELAANYPLFSLIDRHLVRLETQRLSVANMASSDARQWVTWLRDNSYQIDQRESERIASGLWRARNAEEAFPSEVDRFTVDNDLLIGDEVTVVVLQMPASNWKIVTVFKRSTYLSITNGISLQLIGWLSLATLTFGVLAFIVLKQGVLRRISDMVELLSASVQSDREAVGLTLAYEKRDELGMLAYWFNQRSKQLEASRDFAERASRAKSDFLASMSHELRTPLNSIVGFTSRLMGRLEGDISFKDYDALVTVNNNAQHLSGLISDILDLARIESGEERVEVSLVGINNLLDDAVDQVRGPAEEKQLRLILQPLVDEVVCQCDKRKVLQILLNLLENAIKATEHGEISVTAYLEQFQGQPAVTLQVKDTGVGISEQDQRKLFKRFSQLDDRIGAEQGAGLGLYMAAKFVHLHSGDISVSSREGQGTCFVVRLPLEYTPIPSPFDA